MANNISILDSASAANVVKTTDNAGVHTPHHNVDSVVSGAIASGAVASGAVASGAFASGSIASGAIASGAIAAGAIAAGATSIADNEDAASASGDRGVKVLAVQLATPADSAGTDGDYSFLQMSGGRLWCSSVVTGTAAVTQSGTWTVDLGATDNAVLDAIAASLAGTLTVGSHAVTNAGTFAVQAAQSGTWTVDLGATDNAVLDSIAASLAGTLTVGSHAVTNAGTFAVQVDGSALTALQLIDDWDNAASDGASVSGDVAHDTADAGEPVKVGYKATTSISGLTMVAANDRTNGHAGIDGVQIVRNHANLEDIVTGNASNTDGTSTECIAAGAAGIKHYITRVTLTNTSSSNIYVELKDGATAKHTVPLPANGGATIGFDPPLPGSAATAWNFDPSAAASTVYCSMVGFKSKI